MTDLLLMPALVALAVIAAAFGYLLAFAAWWSANSKGVRYFGRPVAERRAFRANVRRYGRLVQPILDAGLGRLVSPTMLDLKVAGLLFPKSACSRNSVEEALRFQPGAGDIIIATQMKCGTTWMQQIVYEVLSRGQGDLGDAGHRHIQAVCPWLEANRGVSLEDAPRIGASSSRIIKTHLPASHCPYGADAKYIYVTRHPVSCFLSTLEFTGNNGGPMVREGEAALDWFCSDLMWWGTWPDHVAGWWRWAQTRENVMFLHFEALKRDLENVVQRVARFLSISLNEAEIAAVVGKSSYGYMKEREEWFEMSPPTIFSFGGTQFKSGSVRRDQGADPHTRACILGFCRERLAGSDFPAGRFYPEIAPGA